MDIIWKSLLASVITAVILLIERYVGPKVAGAIGGIPIVYAISYVLVTYLERDSEKIVGFLRGGVYGALAAIFFCVLLGLLTYKFPEYYWVNFAVSYIACFSLALGLATYA